MAARKYEEMTNDEKIKTNERRIKRLFRDIEKDRRQFVDAIIYQFAFTTVTLERLVAELNSGEVLEHFEQGSQKFLREHPALRSYNTTVKSFIALANQLLNALPPPQQKSAGDELMSFITKPPAAVKK